MVFTLGLCLVLLAFDELTPARLALLLADAVMTNSWGCMTFLTTTIFFQFLRAGAMVGPTALQAFIQVR